MALPTHGRVVIDTTVGELDIELWSKETPKTCRNFLALAMEGYYDGVIFHRVVPGFLVQTGDRTGTGAGGESFYGEPFEDEIHPRLRYAHRGLVGMANNGTKNSNDSQFFITLDRADELQGKHTLFGRCVGDTIYNALKIGELELDSEGKPLYPPKIKSIRILDNPFLDIIPRITAEEKRIQQRAREQAQRERLEEQRRKGAKKNTKLLSFGAEAEQEEEVEVAFKKKSIVRPDLVEKKDSVASIPIPDFVNQPASTSTKTKAAAASSSSKEPDSEANPKSRTKSDQSSTTNTRDDDILKIREKHAQEKASSLNTRRTEIEKMESEIRKLQKRKDGNASSDDENARKKPKKSFLEEELSMYAKKRGVHKKEKGKRKDEGDVLEALGRFRGMLQGVMAVEDGRENEAGDEGSKPNPTVDNPDAEPEEIDRDTGFMAHRLHFPKEHDALEEADRAEREYEVIDPRVRGAKAKLEERERKMKEKGRGDRDRDRDRDRDKGRVYPGEGRGGGGYRERERHGDRDRRR